MIMKPSTIRKELMRRYRRDLERERRIETKGGTPIVIENEYMMTDDLRQQRINYEKSVDSTNRMKAVAFGPKRPRRDKKGAERSEKKFILNCLTSARIRAAKTGVPFDITADDITMPKFCPIFGTEMKWGNKISNDTPSIDRLVPHLGYVKGNVAFMSMKANRIKSNATIEELQAVLDWMKLQQRQERDD